MTPLGHVLLAGSLLMGPQAFAQTVTVPAPADKATINTFTASTGSKVHDIVASTKSTPAPAVSETLPAVRNIGTMAEDERRYTMAVEDARARIGGALSLPLGENGTIMGLGNNPNGGAAVIIKGNLNMSDANGKSKGTGTIEGGISSNGAFVTMKMRF